MTTMRQTWHHVPKLLCAGDVLLRTCVVQQPRRARRLHAARCDYYATVAALLPALGAAIGSLAASLWLALTARIAARRLRGTRHEWRHVGAVRYGVVFR
jgi:hypothetical protein